MWQNCLQFLKETDTFFTLWILLFMCSLNDIFLFTANPRCFWSELNLISDLLKNSSGCVVAFFFLEKIISCICLVWSGLNYIFHWCAQSCSFNGSLLIVETEVFIQFAILNKELSSTKSLILDFNPCGRSFI